MIANQDTVINATFKQLEITSQDTKKRLEYNVRVKAAMDYNTIIEESRAEGVKSTIDTLIKDNYDEKSYMKY